MMRDKMKMILAILLMLLKAPIAYGETATDPVKVYFRVGHSNFDPALRNNRAVMDSFVNIVRKANAEKNIESLVVKGFASPDGTSKANERLSQLRCEAIATYISDHTEVDRNFIRTIPCGVAWGELRKMVMDTPNVPSREKVLDILDHTPIWVYDAHGKIVDGCKAQLMSLSSGDPYRWMLKHLFPELRNSVAIMVYLKNDILGESSINKIIPEDNTVASTIIMSETTYSEPGIDDQTSLSDLAYKSDYSENDTVNMSETINISDNNGLSLTEMTSENAIAGLSENTTNYYFKDSSAGERPNRYFAIKSNMLYDAVLIPNIGAEFYIGKNLSVYGEWIHTWFSNKKRHRYWRLYGGDIGARWWFGSKAKAKPLTGHHLGIYGGVLIFDVEWGGTGYMGGKPGGTILDRCLVNTGIEYGYSLPINRRLNIDFSIGLGYLGGNYIEYYPFDNNYYRQKEYDLRYFGPTKAEISLVWLLGHGNTNNREGGDK